MKNIEFFTTLKMNFFKLMQSIEEDYFGNLSQSYQHVQSLIKGVQKQSPSWDTGSCDGQEYSQRRYKTSSPTILFGISFGPSGVRVLPLAAGINVGGHYKWHFFSFFLSFSFSSPSLIFLQEGVIIGFRKLGQLVTKK